MSFYPKQVNKTKTDEPITQRHPQAQVKYNGKIDMGELRLRDSNRSQKDVLFRGLDLKNDQSDAHMLVADWNIAYIMKDSQDQPGSGQQDLMYPETAIKALQAINGLRGSREAIKDQILPIGVFEMGNADNRSDRYNILRGGAFSLMFNGPSGVRLNGLIEVDVPSVDDAAKMKSHIAAQSKGVNGVVTLMCREFNPLQADYTSVNGMAYYLGINGAQKPIQTKCLRRALAGVYNLTKVLYSESIKSLLKGKSITDDQHDALIASFPTKKQWRADVLKQVTKAAQDGDSNNVTDELNAVMRMMGEIVVQKHHWVMLQAEQPAANGQVVPVHFISIGA